MKKIICILLAAIMTCSLVACGNGQQNNKNTGTNESSKSFETTDNNIANKDTQIASAKAAYQDLNATSIACETIIKSIYGAWYFSIYEEDKYLEFSPALAAFSNKTGLNKSVISTAVEKYIEDSNGVLEKTDITRLAVLCGSSSAIKIVISAYAEVYSNASACLESAKENIKCLTSEYSDVTGYATLKTYYSEVLSYLEFCKSPSGSFKQLGTTIDNYQTNCSKYQNDLSLIFE